MNMKSESGQLLVRGDLRPWSGQQLRAPGSLQFSFADARRTSGRRSLQWWTCGWCGKPAPGWGGRRESYHQGFTLKYVIESIGWEQLKAWPLGYVAGALGGSANARQKGRRELRFKCAGQLTKVDGLWCGR
jgi:hypothetical protein